MPWKLFAINAAWLACALMAIDLVAWTRTILLHDDPALAKAEPKTRRYRLLHVAARLTRGQRRLRLKIEKTWRWAAALASAFHRLHALLTSADLTWRPDPTKITDNPGPSSGDPPCREPRGSPDKTNSPLDDHPRIARE
jgi:hypothetical protein